VDNKLTLVVGCNFWNAVCHAICKTRQDMCF